MSLDIKAQLEGMVKVTSVIIGDKLSTVKTLSGTRPSVIKNRTKGSRPAFPYVAVDYLSPERKGYSTRGRYVNDSGFLVHEYEYELPIIIDIHGLPEDDVQSIAIEFLDKIFLSSYLDLISTETDGLLMDVSGSPAFSFQFNSTDWEEVSRITVNLSVLSVVEDSATGVIEEVSLDGELYADYDQVEPPLDITVNAP